MQIDLRDEPRRSKGVSVVEFERKPPEDRVEHSWRDSFADSMCELNLTPSASGMPDPGAGVEHALNVSREAHLDKFLGT